MSAKLKTGMFLLIIIGVFFAACTFFFLPNRAPVDPEIGVATGQSAKENLRNICGNSYVEELASITDARNSPAPEVYLAEHSIFVLDEDAIEIYVESNITAAESTAQAKDMTVQNLIVDEWGYESVDNYREEVRSNALNFIKQRLAVYQVAETEDIAVLESEYEDQLTTYAMKFGYNTAAEFTYACTPASIASEMLYDKALNVLQE